MLLAIFMLVESLRFVFRLIELLDGDAKEFAALKLWRGDPLAVAKKLAKIMNIRDRS